MSEKLLEYFNGDELASGVWSGKYADKGEVTPDDMHRRLAKEFAIVEDNYIDSESELDNLSEYGQARKFLTEERIYNFFKDFKYIIPQGSIMSQLGVDSIGSLSNCFVVGQPVDSYGGIFQKEQEMIQLMKRRGGVGIDISTLRPEGTSTTNAAKSSTGAVSFMHRYSNGTREVAQKGRRGALMLSIDIKHPDSMEFIKIKRDLTQVTGANISIKLDAEFMKAVENDEDFILRFPCDLDLSKFTPEYIDSNYNELYYIEDHTNNNQVCYLKRVKAKEYWNETIKSAHNVAEPGLMFWDTMVNYSPDGVYPEFKQVTTNPCSEIGMQPYDACRLIAVNLFSFVVNPWSKDAYFDYDKFYEINYEAMRLSDDLIDLEVKHIDRIIAKIESDPENEEIKYVELKLWNKVKATALSSRRTGLGITALGDTLAALGLKYDSDKALEEIESIMKAKMASELDCTTDLAILRGTFPNWDVDTEYHIEFGDLLQGKNPFYDFILEEFPEQATRMAQYGRRNVSWSTVAPTGSLSIMAKLNKYSNVTSGLEPVFAPYYMRRKKVNASDKGARIDFTDQNGDTWQEYPVMMAGFKEWIETQDVDIDDLTPGGLQELYKVSPYWGSTANDINWVRRVEIQGIIQKYITHSISSTINLPSTVTEEEVSEIYLESYKKGLKGITVYRDGSRSGVLVSNDSKPTQGFEYKDAVKRPKELDAEMHIVNIKGSKFTVLVGLLDKKPYEVFGFDYAIEDGIAKKGKLTKVGRGKYLFNGFEISGEMSDEQAAITRLVSTSLRHGSDIKFIVEQLNKTDGDLFSFTKGLARVLKKYIPEGAKSTVHCLDCGSDQVIFQEGCQSCQSCGSSKCG